MKKKFFSFLALLFFAIPFHASFAVTVLPFNTNLYYGLRNSTEVSKLQDFLISKQYLHISLPTGNFFSLTLAAVKNYQRNNAITTTGYVGHLTRASINQELNVASPLQVSNEPLVAAPAFTPAVMPSSLSLSPASSGFQINAEPAYDLQRIAFDIQDLINQERVKAGLGVLTWSTTLAEIARLHSVDQAADDIALTNPDKLCDYPLIRHEGIRGGYDVALRFTNGGLSSYRFAGENIVMISAGKNFAYRYSADAPITACPQVGAFPEGVGTKEERLNLFNQILSASLTAVQNSPVVSWVNKEWLSTDEIEHKALELWLNSPGHRENILRPEFNSGGIGIAPANDYLIITHDFMGQ